MRNLTSISNRMFFRDLRQIARTHEPLLRAIAKRDPGAPELFRVHVTDVWQRLLAQPGGGRTG
ncbi:hypothetical protein G7085_19580 [Tessaracoccus sp. HDW20]|nr:hypothetical protein [Tessaracoccus coleopterorum]